jgi:signal peptidase I
MTAMAKRATVLVEGNSMTPTYNAGDWLLARWADYSLASSAPAKLLHRLHIGNYIAVGDAVVIERAEQPGIYYIKRIDAVKMTADLSKSKSKQSGNTLEKGELVFLLSDNPEGADSRTWGWLPIESIKARVDCRVKRAKLTSL